MKSRSKQLIVALALVLGLASVALADVTLTTPLLFAGIESKNRCVVLNLNEESITVTMEMIGGTYNHIVLVGRRTTTLQPENASEYYYYPSNTPVFEAGSFCRVTVHGTKRQAQNMRVVMTNELEYYPSTVYAAVEGR